MSTEHLTAEQLEVHEAQCRRCGQSCHFAVPVNGLPVVVDDLHCKFLVSTSDGRFACSVYPHRFDVAPWCATVAEALEDGLLAQDCPYAAATPGYSGKTRLHRRLLARAEPAIRRSLIEDGAPLGVDPDGVRRFLSRTGGGSFDIFEDEASGRVRIVPIEPNTEG